MATLSVLRFSTTDGAAAAHQELLALSEAGRFQARDLALVSWEPGKRLPDLRSVDAPRPQAPMAPGFWNLLWSHLFYLPAATAAAGLPPLGAHCSLADLGIRDDFLRTIHDRLVPGTSAMFVLNDDANVDRIIELLDRLEFTVVSTNLSAQQLEALRIGFGGDAAPAGESVDPRPGHSSEEPAPSPADTGVVRVD